MVCQYGAYHESTSSSRQLHVFLHGAQEDDGGQPNSLHHDGVQEERLQQTNPTRQDVIWLLFDTSLLTSSFNLDEPQQFAGRIHRMIKPGMSIDDDDEGLGGDEDLPLLEEVEDAADEASKMEEVDRESWEDSRNFDFSELRRWGSDMSDFILARKGEDMEATRPSAWHTQDCPFSSAHPLRLAQSSPYHDGLVTPSSCQTLGPCPPVV